MHVVLIACCCVVCVVCTYSCYCMYVLYWQGRTAVPDCQINNQSINNFCCTVCVREVIARLTAIATCDYTLTHT